MRGATASKAVASKRFRDMRPLLATPLPEAAHSVCIWPEMDPEDNTEDSCDPEDDDEDAHAVAPVDHYELAMAPELLTIGLPGHNAVSTPIQICVCYSSGMTSWVSTQATDAGSFCTWTLIAVT